MALAGLALSTLPVHYGALALLLAGIALMTAEAFTPGFGVLGLLGFAAFVVGGYFLFDAPSGARRDARVDPGDPGLGGRQRRRSCSSWSARPLKARNRPTVTGPEEMLAARGTVIDWTGDTGNIRIRGEVWAARGNSHAQARRHRQGRQPRRADARGRAGLAPHQEEFMVGNLSAWSALLIPAILILFVLFNSFRILREYERGVVFMLGRLWKVKGPGLILIIPFIQQMVRVDLRTRVLDVEPQDVISRDNVSVRVSAVVYYRVIDPEKAIVQVEFFNEATSQLAQTTLRSVLGHHDLDEMLSERTKLNSDIQKILDEQTDAWGIKVANVEIKQVDINETMIRAIAKQAEAERIRRAKVIDAEGEFQAAQKLADAGAIFAQRPEAMQLRYLAALAEYRRRSCLDDRAAAADQPARQAAEELAIRARELERELQFFGLAFRACAVFASRRRQRLDRLAGARRAVGLLQDRGIRTAAQFLEQGPAAGSVHDRKLRIGLARTFGEHRAVHLARQVDVGEQHIDPRSRRQMRERVLRIGDGVNCMAGIGQRLADDFGDQRFVLDQQYTDFFGGLSGSFRRHALARALVQFRQFLGLGECHNRFAGVLLHVDPLYATRPGAQSLARAFVRKVSKI